MSLAVASTAAPPALAVERKRLLSALAEAQAVVPSRMYKPIFGGVRLEADGSMLHLAATDGELTFTTQLAVEGHLPACVVSCQELVRRLKASKEPSTALTLRARPLRLVVNGGRVEHTLLTLPLEDFPPVPQRWEGEPLNLSAAEVQAALAVTSCAMSHDASRYAISGVLLESDSAGVRLVATDGRRLVVAGLTQVRTRFQGRVILPARMVKLVQKLAAEQDGAVVVAVQAHVTEQGDRLPASVFIAGADWLLAGTELEGSFPLYQDVMPTSASRFTVARPLLLETLQQVMLAAGDFSRGVGVSLRPRSLELSASSAESGRASAKLPARFLGGGDSVIHTGFNPDYLLEAVKTLSGDRVVFDVAQNGCGSDGAVFGKAALLYAEGDEHVRWVLMPIGMGWPATREYLGSNFKEPVADVA